MADTDKPSSSKTSESSVANFLESQPPGTTALITDDLTKRQLPEPHLQLHCSSELCNGNRVFESTDDPTMLTLEWEGFSLYIVAATVIKLRKRMHCAYSFSSVPPKRVNLQDRRISTIWTSSSA